METRGKIATFAVNANLDSTRTQEALNLFTSSVNVLQNKISSASPAPIWVKAVESCGSGGCGC